MVRQWNQIRNKKEQYDPSVLNALCMRFEEPIGSNRWDSPLFSIQIEDTLPARNIAAALFDRKPPPPNMSTLTQPLEASNFLFDLDRKTQEVVKEIFQAQRGACHGEALHIEGEFQDQADHQWDEKYGIEVNLGCRCPAG
jgi:protein KTI12